MARPFFIVSLSLEDLIGNDINDLNDLADERILDIDIVGSLSDINYCVVGHVPENHGPGYLCGSVILNVNADVSDIINEEE